MLNLPRLAVITAGFLPVPAVNGGAVEKLTTILIEQNERQQLFDIDLYTIDDEKIEKTAYQKTRVIRIKVSQTEKFIETNINRIFRKAGIKNNYAFYRSRAVKRFQKRAKLYPYDYVLFENARELLGDIVNTEENDVKYFLHLHNDSSSNTLNPRLDHIAAEKTSSVIAVSNYIRNSFLGKTQTDPDKVKILYNCICDMDQAADKDGAKKLRNRLGIHADDFVYLYVGRINQEKGTHIAAEAFGKLHYDNIRMVICGGTWGNEFKENMYLRQVKQKLGGNLKRTVFTGFIEDHDMPLYYEMCDAVVIPSICQEAFGMVMLEASIRAKPCIAAVSGGMREILSKENAYWVPIDRHMTDNMEKQMKYVYSDHVERIKTAENACKEVRENPRFQAEGYLTRLADIILESEQALTAESKRAYEKKESGI